MVDRLLTPTWSRTKKTLAIALSGVGKGKDDWGNVNNVQYNSNWHCHCESPIYDEYILIKSYFKNLCTLGSSEEFNNPTWPELLFWPICWSNNEATPSYPGRVR
jgi:hypothetical protein